MSRQLLLGVALRDGITFDNFRAGPNPAAVALLRDGREPYVFVWGEAATGKSHLLQAACHAAAEAGECAAYLPLAEPGLCAELLDGLEQCALVACDDLHAIAGDPVWEEALFHLYNRIRGAGGRLLCAARGAPGAIGLRLPDLVSRLGSGPVFRLEPLDDAEKARALQLRARGRGFELGDEVVGYLLRRSARDLHALFALLDRLDEASLTEQRRITVPFVRTLLGE